MENNAQSLREAIIAIAFEVSQCGMSVGTSGNFSVRYDNGFLITPSGIASSELTSSDIVHCDNHGNLLDGNLKPSSEWPFHAEIYQTYDDVNAVVHVHSPYATGLSCTRKPIPAFHYMIAAAGGDSIPCADYATFGSHELSKNIVLALKDRKACLMANHGMVAVGDSIASAFSLAQEVESLAEWYCHALQFGEPVLIDDEEMKTILEKFKHYGVQRAE